MNPCFNENIRRKIMLNYLDCGEKIYYTGKYDIIYRNTQENNNTLICQVLINPTGYNILTAEYIYLNENTMPNTPWIKETYTLSAYDHRMLKKKVGQVTWEGFYPDNGSEGITNSEIEVFNVLGGMGIFRYVTKIVIDFRLPERTMYFIGLCEHAPKNISF